MLAEFPPTRTRHGRLATWSIACLFGLAAGCRDQAPVPQFTYNLGDESARLLPSAGAYHRAYDATILSGSTQATIVRFEEFDPGEAPVATPAAPIAPVAPVQMPPANSMGEAFSNIGSTMLAGIFAGNQGGAAAPPSGASPAAPPSGASAGSAGQPGIDQCIADYNAEWSQRNLAALPNSLVDRQQSVARDYFNLLDELNGSLAAFMPLYQKLSPPAAQSATQKLQQAFSPVSLGGLAIVGTGQAQATLQRADGVTKSVTLEQENGTWRLVHPDVPTASSWPGVESQIQAVIDDLDDGVLDMDGGTPDATKLAGVLSRALTVLLGDGAN